MVREANVKQATAEKQLKEAQGKVSLCCINSKKIKSVITVLKILKHLLDFVPIVNEGLF